MLLAVSLTLGLALSLLVSSTQVLLGQPSAEGQPQPSQVCGPEEHDELLAAGDICSAELLPVSTVTSTSTVTVTATPSASLGTGAAITLDAWTEPPYCKSSLNGSDPFCVFTNATFASGRGISLITTPQIAEIIANTLAFTEVGLLDGINDFSSPPPFFSKPLPGRGIGVIANHTLQRGHRIFAHTAVLIIHRSVATKLTEEDRAELYNKAVQVLPNKTRDEFMALHGHVGTIDKIEDIVITNAFQLYFGDDDVPHNGMFPETSRMNHDCRPNGAYFFDRESLTHFTHAVRPIYPGEEITISYTDQTALYDDRQTALESSWGFDCTCSLCSSPRMFIDESDKRIDIMRNLTKALNNWTENSTATSDMAETLVEFYKLERLESALGDAYKQAALTYASFGHLYHAMKHGAASVEYLMLTSGPVDSEVIALQEFTLDPTKHWSWMQRMIKPSEWSEFFNTTILERKEVEEAEADDDDDDD